MSQSRESRAKATSIARSFDTTLRRFTGAGIDVTSMSWLRLGELLVMPVTNPLLGHLARYALADTETLVLRVQEGLPSDMSRTERRALLRQHAEHIYGPPAKMTDDGKGSFFDGLNPDSVRYAPDDEAMPLSWDGFDFDYYTSYHSGCPALEVPPFEGFYTPATGEQGLARPQNFLAQLFHLAVDMIVADEPNR